MQPRWMRLATKRYTCKPTKWHRVALRQQWVAGCGLGRVYGGWPLRNALDGRKVAITVLCKRINRLSSGTVVTDLCRASLWGDEAAESWSANLKLMLLPVEVRSSHVIESRLWADQSCRNVLDWMRALACGRALNPGSRLMRNLTRTWHSSW